MSTDLYWSLDEDYVVGEDGDLRDTSFDSFRGIYQEMRTRGMASFYDWREHPNLGSNMDELIGQPNNRVTAEDGKARLVSALTLGGFLPKTSIGIRYLPITKDRLMYFIEVKAVDIDTGKTRMLKTQILWDTLEGKATVI